MPKQPDLFLSKPDRPPLVVAYGMGVNSTAVLVELARREIRPDLILFADTGSEKDETYAYEPIIQQWLVAQRFPPMIMVKYRPFRFKNHPPYSTLEGNCLTNGTLPSIAFGFHSCSVKWKIVPQDKYVDAWEPAQAAWAYGMKVRKLIGYDAGKRDRQRYARRQGQTDPKYNFWYPLIEWGIDRAGCVDLITSEGLPVPPKSACYFCTAMKPDEVRTLPEDKLRKIVQIEARAKPRLKKVEGLWRSTVKGMRGATPRPGSMTTFIEQEGLLPLPVIERIKQETPKALQPSKKPK